MKLTKRQLECLKEVDKMESSKTAILFIYSTMTPFKRKSHSYYTDFNFAIRTFEKLYELKLIEHKRLNFDCISESKFEVVLTNMGREYLTQYAN